MCDMNPHTCRCRRQGDHSHSAISQKSMPCIKPSPDDLQMNRKDAMTALREQHMVSSTVEQEDLGGTTTVLQAQIGQASEHKVSLTQGKSKRELKKLLGLATPCPLGDQTTFGAYRAANNTLSLFVEEV